MLCQRGWKWVEHWLDLTYQRWPIRSSVEWPMGEEDEKGGRWEGEGKVIYIFRLADNQLCRYQYSESLWSIVMARQVVQANRLQTISLSIYIIRQLLLMLSICIAPTGGAANCCCLAVNFALQSAFILHQTLPGASAEAPASAANGLTIKEKKSRNTLSGTLSASTSFWSTSLTLSAP